MKRGTRSVLIAIVLPVLSFAGRQAFASDTAGVHVRERAEDKALRITVHPAPEPRPALKHQLLPEFLDRTPGNAAVDYGKVTAEQWAIFGNDEWWEENWAKRIDAPLAELRGQALELPIVFQTLDRAARREHCDWQVPIREGSFYTILLPEVQQIRRFARLLGLRARIQIANGQFDEAVYTLQTGYALGRHVAEGPTIIHGLVGISICGIMSEYVLEMAQQPDAPNLYWALTMLPRPLVSGHRGIEAEMNAVPLTFPELRDLENTTRTPEQWRDSLQEFWEGFVPLASGSGPTERPEVLTALVLKGYPMAKQGLIERGRSPEQVEAMPVSQVVLLYTRETFEELRDDLFKWLYVPYWESHEGVAEAIGRLKQSELENQEVIPLAARLLPALRRFASVVARNDRDIAVLRIIEALRMHAAAHEGRLPGKLGDLTVPVPIDPVTGRPFTYRVEDGTAVIEGPPLPGVLLRVEVKVAR